MSVVGRFFKGVGTSLFGGGDTSSMDRPEANNLIRAIHFRREMAKNGASADQQKQFTSWYENAAPNQRQQFGSQYMQQQMDQKSQTPQISACKAMLPFNSRQQIDQEPKTPQISACKMLFPSTYPSAEPRSAPKSISPYAYNHVGQNGAGQQIPTNNGSDYNDYGYPMPRRRLY